MRHELPLRGVVLGLPLALPCRESVSSPMRLPPVKDSMPVEAAGEKFTLPVVTRAAAAAGAAEMADVVASLLRLCSDEPVTAVVAVADALSKRHPTQCVGSSRDRARLRGPHFRECKSLFGLTCSLCLRPRVATTHTLLSRALQVCSSYCRPERWPVALPSERAASLLRSPYPPVCLTPVSHDAGDSCSSAHPARKTQPCYAARNSLCADAAASQGWDCRTAEGTASLRRRPCRACTQSGGCSGRMRCGWGRKGGSGSACRLHHEEDSRRQWLSADRRCDDKLAHASQRVEERVCGIIPGTYDWRHGHRLVHGTQLDHHCTSRHLETERPWRDIPHRDAVQCICKTQHAGCFSTPAGGCRQVAE